MAKSSTKNALKALPAPAVDTSAPAVSEIEEGSTTETPADPLSTSPAAESYVAEVAKTFVAPDLAPEMVKTIGGQENSSLRTAMQKIEETFVPVPTVATFSAILGRFKIGDKEHIGDRNGTRWIADIELDGSTAVDLKIELLGHGTGAPITPPLVSFTLGAGNGNFYVARPHIVEEKGVLFLRTVALKMSAKVKLRLAIDTYHSSNR